VARELLKLLWQMAWSDGELSGDEENHMRDIAKSLAGDSLTADVDAWLAKSAVPGPPDMGLLKKHATLVMGAAGRVAIADGIIRDDERDFAQILADMLHSKA
jgi:tellurite resistance protein